MCTQLGAATVCADLDARPAAVVLFTGGDEMVCCDFPHPQITVATQTAAIVKKNGLTVWTCSTSKLKDC